jgi:type IV secretion system protein VirB6
VSACPSFSAEGAAGIAQALRSVDCLSGEATAAAFGRLFGADGRLLPALTLILTLYVAFFAIGLLTGRTRIGVAQLTPRMLTLGLVLTFATSWIAYSQVVWTLAVGAPDQVAGILTGSHGSATAAFADRLDGLFKAVADAAQSASKPAPPTETGVTPATPMVGGFTAATVLWLSAIMLLLGSVGVLITTRIALAALLALGPIFIVLALFRGTRGLFEGWLKGVVLFAVTPLLAVLIGGGAVVALDPVVRGLEMAGGEPDTRAVAVLFVGAAVFVALMVIAVKTAGTLVAGWRLPWARDAARDAEAGASAGYAAPSATGSVAAVPGSTSTIAGDARVREVVAAMAPSTTSAGAGSDQRMGSGVGRSRADVIRIDGAAVPGGITRDARVLGIGQRFRPVPASALPKPKELTR